VYQKDILYASSENEKLISYANAVNVPYSIEPDLGKLAKQGFTKALFIDKPDCLDALQVELRKLFGGKAHIAKSKETYLEVTHLEANKGSALLHLAKKLGIDCSEIIGIGDNHNDFELITTAGLGIAMGNAVKELKDSADYISLTNNEEGVRHAIEKFILEPMSVIIE
jgi:Cof subfamily protein (haloacid dehalogenase superfamily)